MCSLHRVQDLHPEHAVAGIDYLTTCGVRLQLLSQLHRQVAARQLVRWIRPGVVPNSVATAHVHAKHTRVMQG